MKYTGSSRVTTVICYFGVGFLEVGGSCSLSSINHLDEITEEECKELIRNYYMVKELIK